LHELALDVLIVTVDFMLTLLELLVEQGRGIHGFDFEVLFRVAFAAGMLRL